MHEVMLYGKILDGCKAFQFSFGHNYLTGESLTLAFKKKQLVAGQAFHSWSWTVKGSGLVHLHSTENEVRSSARASDDRKQNQTARPFLHYLKVAPSIFSMHWMWKSALIH